MKRFKVTGHVLRREIFTIEVDAENAEDARREAHDLWHDGGEVNDDFEFQSDEPERGFDADEVEELQ